MKNRSFFGGVVTAAVLGFFASAIVASLTPFMSFGTALRLVIPVLSLSYIVYLLRLSSEPVGRVTALSLWCAMTVLTWWAVPSLTLYLLIHVAAIWLLRSLYFYSSLLAALMDFGLSALGVSAAFWAITRTGSFFLATWCFFLVQALFAAIPPAPGRRHERQDPEAADSGRFETARSQADQALRQLMTR